MGRRAVREVQLDAALGMLFEAHDTLVERERVLEAAREKLAQTRATDGVRVRRTTAIGAGIPFSEKGELGEPLGGEGDAAWRGGGAGFEVAPQGGRQAVVQGAAAAGIDVDAVADAEVDVGGASFEDERIETGGAEAVGEGQAAEAAASDEDTQGHG